MTAQTPSSGLETALLQGEGMPSDFDPDAMSHVFPTEPVNHIDPDIIAYNLDHDIPMDDSEEERTFMEFFKTEWLDPKYDDLRETWDKHINDEDAHGRLMGKIGLWSVIQLRDTRAKAKESIAELEARTGKKIPYYE